MRHTSASPMPVFPDDGSRMVWPGRNEPSASAASTMARAMRSFTDPAGFCPSSFTSSRTPALGLIWLTSTRGVLPIRSRTERIRATPAPALSSPAGDGGQDRDHVVGGDLRVEALEEPDVFVVPVDVDEAVQLAFLGDELPGETRELAHAVFEHFGDGGPSRLDRRLAGGVLAQHSGKA